MIAMIQTIHMFANVPFDLCDMIMIQQTISSPNGDFDQLLGGKNTYMCPIG
jgi:hypothetical protein